MGVLQSRYVDMVVFVSKIYEDFDEIHGSF